MKGRVSWISSKGNNNNNNWSIIKMIPYTKDTDDYKARRWKEIKRKELFALALIFVSRRCLFRSILYTNCIKIGFSECKRTLREILSTSLSTRRRCCRAFYFTAFECEWNCLDHRENPKQPTKRVRGNAAAFDAGKEGKKGRLFTDRPERNPQQ